MRKGISFLLMVILFSGCRTTFQSSWRDFRAYYNTYYNAKKSYELGLDKNLKQEREYNPLVPVRIHKSPLNAGASDFEKAIEKGADVLRKFNESKWVDDVLALIGKSYYFRSEFFSADQKFQELYSTTENDKLKMEAVIWRTRVMLDMELYNPALEFANEQMPLFEGKWNKHDEAEMHALKAQILAKQENWDSAIEELNLSLKHLPQKDYKERGYFLLGQLYEKVDDEEEAFKAYDKVEDYYTEYQVQFLAKKKKAEVARQLGYMDEAYKVFASMVKDDKNTELVADLKYELGKTEQDRGNFEEAEYIYNGILRNKIQRLQPETKTKTYYGLAEIYRYGYNNFALAAAYYDSAARLKVSQDKLPQDYRADELSKSFGEYARIKSEIAESDSLLWLGTLPRDKFDSVLVKLQEQKKEEMERLKKEQLARQNTIVNVETPSGLAASETSRNGFLNEKNPLLLADVRTQFKAIWGNRPLVDNWRLASVLKTQISESTQDSLNASFRNTKGTSDEYFSIDLSRVPFTKRDQDSVKNKIASMTYQLGNLFFLSLDDADSAEFYFRQVADQYPNSDVVPVSYYSLSELNSIKGDSARAKEYALQLLVNYPDTEYADRLIEKFNLDVAGIEFHDKSTAKANYLSIVQNDSLSDSEKATKLKQFSRANISSQIAPYALHDAIRLFVQKAKESGDYPQKYSAWASAKQEWDESQKTFQALKDSAKIALKDTTLAEDQSQYYQNILDSTLTSPDFRPLFPYTGTYWDSARTSIDLFMFSFSKSELIPQITVLKKEFQKPEEPKVAQVTMPKAGDKLEESGAYLNCKELDEEIYIRQGKEAFLKEVVLSDKVVTQPNLQITFRFFINQRGIIDKYELISEDQKPEVVHAFNEAIEKFLTFEPVLIEGAATPVTCEISFPVKGTK